MVSLGIPKEVHVLFGKGQHMLPRGVAKKRKVDPHQFGIQSDSLSTPII